MLDRGLLRKARESIAASDYAQAVRALHEVDVHHLNEEEREEIRALFSSIPEEDRAASPIHCIQEMQFAWYEGRSEDFGVWHSRLLRLRTGCKADTTCRSMTEKCICCASFMLPRTDNAQILLMLAVLANDKDSVLPFSISVTSNYPSILRGSRDLSVWGQHYGAVAEIVRPLVRAVYGSGSPGRVE